MVRRMSILPRSRRVTVSFDRAMETKKHGFHLFEEKQPVDPKSTTFSYSADGKTFTLAYAFKPSTHYEVQMNSTEDIGFAATNRVPLWPVHVCLHYRPAALSGSMVAAFAVGVDKLHSCASGSKNGTALSQSRYNPLQTRARVAWITHLRPISCASLPQWHICC